MSANGSQLRLNRRRFLRSAAGAGAALALGPVALGQGQGVSPSEEINVALVGAGSQGKVLLEAARRIEGVRFRAVCDIWLFNRRWVSRRLKAYGHECNAYEDIAEMLHKEKDLDAVIIATPDFWHARHTVACLNAGLHVYCEKEMSNTLDGARQMVEAARKTGKLLQIGHQRRSNPRYIFCCEKLLKEVKLLGRIVAVNGQWNRAVHTPLGWPKQYEIDAATLGKYGYDSMQQFRNWRWYKGLGGGPIVDLGSHQIDVYNWFLGARPTSVLASGRTNYYDNKTHQWYDTVVAVYEYEVPQGGVTASYQTLTANRHLGYFEKFMGDEGTLVISERSFVGQLCPEPTAQQDGRVKWATGLKDGYLTASKAVMEMVDRMTVQQLAKALSVDPSPLPISTNPSATTGAALMSCNLSIRMDKPAHQPHLENFFGAVRGKAKLNCSAKTGYETAVTVLKVNEAAEAGRKLSFKPAEYVV
ncbi:MAG: Gfo/Idh/MocA family oxidoreductase [Sedimentisphaerales bacterium]|nr:Gfo/Idh/MocA family oxidoreductase [Sedimentisphaerales bacterium]